jgi:hypothetical protein
VFDDALVALGVDEVVGDVSVCAEDLGREERVDLARDALHAEGSRGGRLGGAGGERRLEGKFGLLVSELLRFRRKVSRGGYHFVGCGVDVGEVSGRKGIIEDADGLLYVVVVWVD